MSKCNASIPSRLPGLPCSAMAAGLCDREPAPRVHVRECTAHTLLSVTRSVACTYAEQAHRGRGEGSKRRTMHCSAGCIPGSHERMHGGMQRFGPSMCGNRTVRFCRRACATTSGRNLGHVNVQQTSQDISISTEAVYRSQSCAAVLGCRVLLSLGVRYQT